MKQKIFLVTGGLGFMGKYFIKHLLNENHYVINIDKISYSADIKVMPEFEKYDNYTFAHLDINNVSYLPECDYIVNFAAETHVDNSISSSNDFINTNVVGVQHLLELVRSYREDRRPIVIQISTDEVYGDTAEFSSPEGILTPSSPYSSTKAAADLLISAWNTTYDLEYKIVRLSNVYGEHQYPEKLIPKACMQLSRGLPAPMHGFGHQERTWLHVDDAIKGIYTVIDKGDVDSIYNIAGHTFLTVREVLIRLCKLYNISYEKGVTIVPDRKGQDVQYKIDDLLTQDLGWTPKRKFDIELSHIVNSYDISRFMASWKGKSLIK
tara:strand:+ start:8364 stop:9332 length:969 start_codon:yes stop_codon:yes gene_type:complete